MLNTTDPWTEVDGERSSVKTKHPTLTDPAVRQALVAAGRQGFDREAHLRPHRHRHGELRQQPGAFHVRRTPSIEFNIDKANKILDDGRLEARRRRHPREGRQEAEVRLPDLDQPAAPEEPGDRQAGLPEGRHRHRAEVGDGVGVLLVRRRQSGHLQQVLLRPADVQRRPCRSPTRSCSCASSDSWEVATKENKWQGRNITRWRNKEYDDVHKAAQVELDPVKRAAMFIKCNDTR